eukprot:1821013-Pleurochrysis_carterae.AAC.2
MRAPTHILKRLRAYSDRNARMYAHTGLFAFIRAWKERDCTRITEHLPSQAPIALSALQPHMSTHDR